MSLLDKAIEILTILAKGDKKRVERFISSPLRMINSGNDAMELHNEMLPNATMEDGTPVNHLIATARHKKHIVYEFYDLGVEWSVTFENDFRQINDPLYDEPKPRQDAKQTPEPRKRFKRVPFTESDRKIILKRDRYTCQHCGANPVDNPDVDLHIDHILPVTRGGDNSEDNLQVLCASCNLKKGNKLESEL